VGLLNVVMILIVWKINFAAGMCVRILLAILVLSSVATIVNVLLEKHVFPTLVSATRIPSLVFAVLMKTVTMAISVLSPPMNALSVMPIDLLLSVAKLVIAATRRFLSAKAAFAYKRVVTSPDQTWNVAKTAIAQETIRNANPRSVF
jgi:hypothetical protein